MIYTGKVYKNNMFGIQKNPFLDNQTDKSGKDVFTDFLQTVVLALAFSLILYLVFLVPSIVDGPSMLPNFHDRELLFANKTIQWLGGTSFGEKYNYDYQRGDVIIFRKKNDNLIKRVIATGGDTVMIKEGDIYINGNLLKELYMPTQPYNRISANGQPNLTEGETVTVPDGSYFVMGDNRDVSNDSRYLDVGFVPREHVKGKVFFRYWPITRFGIIGTGEYEEVSVSN